jgi:uncharacterized protein YukE
MADFLNIVADEVMGHVQTIGNQAKVVDELKHKVDGMIAEAITGGKWKGAGADAFGEYMRTKYIPDTLKLIAAIGGFGGELSAGLDMFNQADQAASSTVSGIVDQLHFF